VTTTLTEQARRESGLGLAWASALTLTAPNGAPNSLPLPLANSVGFDASGYVWGVYAVRCDPGQTCTFRLHFRWAGLAAPDDGWDEVQNSDVSVAAGRSASQRARCAGASRVYVELLTLSGGNVKVLWGNATGVA
jgi:hypothetical protein